MSTFAERLDKALRLRKMKPADLARATGLTEGQISAYRKGTYEAKQKSIYLIAKALNVSEPWLMGYDVNIERLPDAFRTLPQNISVIEAGLLADFRKLNTAGQKAAAKVVKSFTTDPDYAIQTESEAEPSTKKDVSSSA